MEELKEKYYNEGVFPEGTLKRIEAASEYDGNEVAFLASRGTFFLPEKELNDEEILQIIDFREKPGNLVYMRPKAKLPPENWMILRMMQSMNRYS